MWKYFKDSLGAVYVYAADGSQDAYIKPGLIAITEAQANALRSPAPTLDQVQAAFVGMIQGRLDAFARTRNYDNIQSACSYMLSSVDKFQDEGTYAMQARDATWSAAYAILAQVQAGTRPVPTSLEDIEGDLPALEWP